MTPGTQILLDEIKRRTIGYNGDYKRAYKEVLTKVLEDSRSVEQLRLVLLAMVEMA